MTTACPGAAVSAMQKKGSVHIRALLVFLYLAAVCLPAGASAEERSFIPVIRPLSSNLDLDMIYEIDQNKSKDYTYKYTDTAFRQQLDLKTGGFIYHPRFISFMADGAFGIQEERNKQHDTGYEWDITSVEEYEVRGILLPKHPYNLELFTRRDQPLMTSRYMGTLQPVITQSGAYLRYKKRPWSAAASYVRDHSKSQYYTLDNSTYRFDSGYFTQLLSLDGSYQHSDSDTSQNSDMTMDQVHGAARMKYRMVRLNAEFQWDKNDENDQGDYRMENERRLIRAWSDVELPWNFTTRLGYRQNHNDYKTRYSSNTPESSNYSYTDLYEFQLDHRLFSSLFSTLYLNYADTDSTGGRDKRSSYNLNMNYQKKIPTGTFSASFSFGSTRLDRNGATSQVNETRHARLFEDIPLKGAAVNPDTIEMFVKDAASGRLLPLYKNQHYILILNSNIVTIQVIAVPPEVSQPDLNYVYEFLINYAFKMGKYKLDTDNMSYSFNLNIFRGLLNPYYRHSSYSQDLVSGYFPSELEDRTTSTYGLTLRRWSASLTAEYQDIDSRLTPEETWRMLADYRRQIFQALDMKFDFKFERDHYPRGKRGVEDDKLTDKLYQGTLMTRYQLARQHLHLVFSGSYAHRTGITDNDFYYLDSYLTWERARLNLKAGAYYSNSKTTFSGDYNKVKSAYFYIKLQRTLF